MTRHLLIVSCLAACSHIPTEGEVCNDTPCADNLACVPDVGSEYGEAPTDDVCERPHSMYDIMAYGERGENRRVDETIDMIDGTYRMPRFTDGDERLTTAPYSDTLADGTVIACTGSPKGKAHECLVPDWPSYYGTELSQYDRFFFFSLRMESSLIYTAFYSPTKRLIARYAEAKHVQLDTAGVEWLRREAKMLAIAVMNDFVTRGHRAFALDQMPACYTGASGYQNPNASWAPVLDQWDPAMRIDDERARLDQAEDVPADCTGAIPHTYFTLRDSLWYPHAVAFRAIALANAYFLFRGMMTEPQRDAWLRAIRETGDGLALPSSYEPNQNHGITESAALIQLAYDFSALLPTEVTEAWMTLGRYRLNDLIVDTVFPDGVQVEQSPMYHNYELVLLLQILDWMDARKLDLTTGIDPAARIDYDSQDPAPLDRDIGKLNATTDLKPRTVIDGMVRASVHIAQPDGWIPWIGSSVPQQYRGYEDDVLTPYIDDHRSFSEQLKFFQSGGESGKAPSDSERLTVFDYSGLVTMHSAFKPDFTKQTQVVFNTGMPYHKHSHPDALAVHLFGPDTTPGAKTGMALLVDSGWFSYDAIGTYFFKSTIAHNTVNVDGKNQCVHDPQRMRFDPYQDGPLPSCTQLTKDDPKSGLIERGSSLHGSWHDTSWLYQSAHHTLYADTNHRRGVLLLGREVLVVIDMLESSAPHTFAQTWHLAPRIPPLDSAPSSDDGTFHLTFARSKDDAAPLMSLHEATEGAELRLHHGEPSINGIPGQGWYSTREEESQPNAVVELRREGVTSTAFASVFLLGSRAGENAVVTLRRDDASTGTVTVRFKDGKTLTLGVAHLGEPGSETVEVK